MILAEKRKSILEPIFTFVLNVLTLTFCIISFMDSENNYKFLALFFPLILIFEYLSYKKKDIKYKLRYSCCYFALSVFMYLIFIILSLYYLNFGVSCETEQFFQALIYIRLFPVVYIYPIFIYPSGFCLIIYSGFSKVKKCILIMALIIITLLLPQIIYR